MQINHTVRTTMKWLGICLLWVSLPDVGALCLIAGSILHRIMT